MKPVRSILVRVGAVSIMALGAAACAVEQGESDVAQEWTAGEIRHRAVALEDGQAPPDAVAVEDDHYLLAETVTAEQLAREAEESDGAHAEESGKEGDPSVLAGCVRVQWCNEPGAWGTTCFWDACSFDAAWNECIVDANFVCGAVTPPMSLVFP